MTVIGYIYCNTVIDKELNAPRALPAKGKALALIKYGGAIDMNGVFPENIDSVAGDCVLICVVQNGAFDAAAILATPIDFDSMKNRDYHGDLRPKNLLLIEKKYLLKEELEALE